jgi:hypothetical protein
VLLLLVGCGPTVADTKTQFCNDWQAFGTAIQNAKNLNENSTVEEAKAAQDEIVKAFEKAKSSGAELQEVQLQATEDAVNAVTQAINSIPEEATLGQAGAVIQASANALESAYTAINTTVCVAR